jgi:hypothetical protein
MRLVIGLLLISFFAIEGEAATASRVEPRSTPMVGDPARVAPRTARQATLEGESHPALSSARSAALLNCENDNEIAPSSSLRLLPGDMAGNIFEIDPGLLPYQIDTVSFALLRQTLSQVPVLIGLDLFVYDAQQDVFSFISGFDITLDDIDAGGTIFDVDLSEFGVEGDGDLLTLYGDFTNGTVDAMVNPAGDASPRCLNAAEDNVCSVLLPVDEDTLLIYGIDDETCGTGILNFDLVHEVTLAPVVATPVVSWGSVKARF